MGSLKGVSDLPPLESFLTTKRNFQKLGIWARKMATLSKKRTKPSVAKRCISFWNVWACFLIVTRSDFIQTPHSSSREPTARRRSLWSKCWRRMDSRHNPCTSDASSPSSPPKFSWEKSWSGSVCDDASAPTQDDAHAASTRGSRPGSPTLSWLLP